MNDRIAPSDEPTPSAFTTIHVHIQADSLASLREQLQKAMDEMGWAPAAPAPMKGLANVWPMDHSSPEAPAPAAPATDMTAMGETKPKRTRKPKEEAPAEPAADPTSPSSSPAPTAAGSEAVSPPTEPGPTTPAAPAEVATPSTPAAPSSGLTHEGVKKRAEAWMNEHPDGVPEAKKQIRGYLASFGVSRVAELPVESLQDFLDTIEGV